MPPRLYPEKRLKQSKGKLVATELSFLRDEESGISWPLFLGLGFLLAASIYHRELKKLKLEQEELVV